MIYQVLFIYFLCNKFINQKGVLGYFSASASNSAGTNSKYSSLKVNIAEGSIPKIGVL